MKPKSFIIAGVLLCLLSSFAMGATDIFPLEEVYPGLTGIGKTVVQGTLVEDFDVEIIAVVPQPQPTKTLIMVRVSGDAIDRSGGIAAGMSGSPVYIDDKLLGAISYAYYFSDHRVGMVTPAASMLALTDRFPRIESTTFEVPMGFHEIATPLTVSGFSGRVLNTLTQHFQAENVQIIPGISGSLPDLDSVSLEPGSAIAVQLLRGDYQIAAFGTLTAIDDLNRFVGFGHSFMHMGDVNFFAAPAEVHYTIANLENPYKIMSAGKSNGVVYQDRDAGVGGIFGSESDYIPIQVTVTDLGANVEKTYNFESVVDEYLLPILVFSSTNQGIDSTLDRIGSGTAYLRLEFHADNLPNPIIRQNMVYSDSDIAGKALWDLQAGLDLITENRLQKINLSQINASFTFDEQRKTAEILQAIPQTFQVKPGDSVDVEVKIRPYRGATETRILRLEIPEDTLPGPMAVTVRGNNSNYYYNKPVVHITWESLQGDKQSEILHGLSKAESLDLLFSEYMNWEQNNQIVAEFYPYIDIYAVQGNGTDNGEEQMSGDTNLSMSGVEILDHDFGVPQWDRSGNDPFQVRLTTQYVIEGEASFQVEVL